MMIESRLRRDLIIDTSLLIPGMVSKCARQALKYNECHTTHL